MLNKQQVAQKKRYCFECLDLILERDKEGVATGLHKCKTWNQYRALWQPTEICTSFKDKEKADVKIESQPSSTD